MDSLTLVGSLLTADSLYGTYYRTIRDPQQLRQLAKLSQPGPPLQLSGTEHKLSTQSFGLHWYRHGAPQCQFDAAQTRAGQPYTNCSGGYNFRAQPQLIRVLDSLLRAQPDGR